MWRFHGVFIHLLPHPWALPRPSLSSHWLVSGRSEGWPTTSEVSAGHPPTECRRVDAPLPASRNSLATWTSNTCVVWNIRRRITRVSGSAVPATADRLSSSATSSTISEYTRENDLSSVHFQAAENCLWWARRSGSTSECTRVSGSTPLRRDHNCNKTYSKTYNLKLLQLQQAASVKHKTSIILF